MQRNIVPYMASRSYTKNFINFGNMCGVGWGGGGGRERDVKATSGVDRTIHYTQSSIEAS
jgi:hypothetical protein